MHDVPPPPACRTATHSVYYHFYYGNPRIIATIVLAVVPTR
jgi:hypothetical protein